VKYTNYLINGNFINVRALENVPKIFLPISLTVAIMGVIMLSGAIPITFMIDTARNVHCMTIKLDRKLHVSQTVTNTRMYYFIDRNVHNVLNKVA
jgi:hypothetical protein